MKQVKYIFLAMEVLCIMSVASLSFLTDWSYCISSGDDWMFKLLIVLMSLMAIVFQREQQDIDLEEE